MKGSGVKKPHRWPATKVKGGLYKSVGETLKKMFS